MFWYEGSIWQYGWVFPVLMAVVCLLMMVNMKGRCCCPKGGWRQRSAPEDDVQETMSSRRERR